MIKNYLDGAAGTATITIDEDDLFWIWASMQSYIDECEENGHDILAAKLTRVRRELGGFVGELQDACTEHAYITGLAARAARIAKAKADLEDAIQQGY